MPKQRAFEVSVLKEFSNFRVLKTYIVISETRPQPEELPLGEREEVMKVVELQAEVIIK